MEQSVWKNFGCVYALTKCISLEREKNEEAACLSEVMERIVLNHSVCELSLFYTPCSLNKNFITTYKLNFFVFAP